jgi:pre-rRNA-processing protein IPI3
MRVLTCSLDRSLVLYDISASRQCYSVQLPESAECMVVSPLGTAAFIGGPNGVIHIHDMSQVGVSLTAAHQRQSDGGEARLEGHSRKVTSLVFSLDNCTLVSGSEDGSVRVWDTWTRQCVREFKPMNKCAITSVVVRIAASLKSSLHMYLFPLYLD